MTEKNEIRGQAVVRSPDGRTTVSTKVSIHFTIPDVAPVDELLFQWHALGFVRNGQTGAFDLVTGGAGR
ncbi:MAG TPA: hypothetical protein VM223_18700 [Planctomycetota bacterium]|nr:hypothetical protein [Planctomycetota bacterium]